ncbi:MAG: hypothetical protein QXP77_02465 [Candidatus Aenigmatarchaeota archaeon]
MFPFGKGKIEIILEKYNFSPGEIIKGRVILKLKEPIMARALKVGLIGEEKSFSGKKKSSTKIFSFEMPLDGEKEYLEGEYNFELKIPSNLLTMPQIPGVIGDVIKGIQILSGVGTRISWYVIAKLDIPSGLDVSKKVQVNIG